MLASTRALLTEIIDYAGMFPPAKLPLDQALRNFAQYRACPESWLLGRFICPMGQLALLSAIVQEHLSLEQPMPLVVLGTADLQADAGTIRNFLERNPSRFRVEGYESKWPASGSLPEFSGIAGRIFSEISLDGDWKTTIIQAIEKLETAKSPRHGLKLRCGGEQASAFPTPEQLALTLKYCRDAAVPLKFTAGLHHPIRHFDRQLGIKAHGFLNVFVAGALAHALGLDESTIRRIIEEENAANFQFAEEQLGWRNHFIASEQISAARARLVTSFGSCSFEEPVADLREMRLLPLAA